MYPWMEIKVSSPNVSQIVIPLCDHKVIGHKKTNITLPVIAKPKKSVNSADSIFQTKASLTATLKNVPYIPSCLSTLNQMTESSKLATDNIVILNGNAMSSEVHKFEKECLESKCTKEAKDKKRMS